MSFVLIDSQKVAIAITPKDKAGQPAKVDGAPVWLTSNSEVLTVETAADGLSAVVTAVGPLGTATISVSADADLGEGSTPLSGSIDIEVQGGAAVTLDLQPGTPEDKS